EAVKLRFRPPLVSRKKLNNSKTRLVCSHVRGLRHKNKLLASSYWPSQRSSKIRRSRKKKNGALSRRHNRNYSSPCLSCFPLISRFLRMIAKTTRVKGTRTISLKKMESRRGSRISLPSRARAHLPLRVQTSSRDRKITSSPIVRTSRNRKRAAVGSN